MSGFESVKTPVPTSITDGSCNPNRGISFTLASSLIEGSFSENAWIGLGFRLDAVEVRGSELCIWVKSAKPPVTSPKSAGIGFPN